MLRLSTALAVAAPLVKAIVVSQGSPCASQCGNLQDSTATDDIVCDQNLYSSDNTGQVFAGCLDCELGSAYGTSEQTDASDALYNLRFAASYCLWGYPKSDKTVNTPCITSKACGPFEDGIKYGNLSSVFKTYDYCRSWPTDDSIDFLGCTQCLEAGGQQYLANFMTMLQAGCEQKPVINTTISYEGEVFSTQVVNITSPTPSAHIDPAWFDHGPINLGAKVGIAVGGFVFLLIVAGAFIICNGKRRRRAYLRKLEAKYKGWPISPQNQQAEMFETPVSQRPLHGWDDSPVSASHQHFPQYFSPYSSQYNSPVSAQEGTMQWPVGALPPHQQEIGVALGDTHNSKASTWTQDGKQPETRGRFQGPEESYEMHEVDTESSGSSKRGQYTQYQHQAPVLNHPGYGRNSGSPPGRTSAYEQSGSHENSMSRYF